MPLVNTSLSSRLVMVLLASMVGMSMSAAEAKARPRLVVGIVVDGLERDYIDLLRGHFGQGGFNRLLRDGVVIANADYGTSLDATAATAMLMTGASPSVNGVSEAVGYDIDGRRKLAVLYDQQSIGNYTNETYSPRNLFASTIADEVRIAGGGVTCVYAIAPDAQQSIILGGHAANSAIWINDITGNWSTTTFYKDAPMLLGTRNRLSPLSSRLDTMSWSPLLEAGDYPDLPDHLKHYPFRYVFPRSDAGRYEKFKKSASVNAEVTSMATEFINTLNLGSHDGVDMLNVAYTLRPFDFSKNTDNRFEQMDAYVRLDRNLEQLFAAVDKAGGGNSVVFLAATPPSTTARRDDEQWNIPYGEFSTRKAGSLLNMYLMAVYGNGEWLSGFHNGRFFLNGKLIKEKGLDAKAVRAEAASFIARMSGVKDVFTIDEILSGHAGEHGEALKRNTHLATAGDILVKVLPGWEVIDDYGSDSSKGSSGLVERMVATTAPVFIMATDVAPKRFDTPVDIRVIAPTIAQLLRIRSPNAAALPALELD